MTACRIPYQCLLQFYESVLELSRGQELLVVQRGKKVLHWPAHLEEGVFRTSSVEVEKEWFVLVPHSDGDRTADVQIVHGCETRCPIGGFSSRPCILGWGGARPR